MDCSNLSKGENEFNRQGRSCLSSEYFDGAHSIIYQKKQSKFIYLFIYHQYDLITISNYQIILFQIS
jgi:hypothetical protein